ncbi:MAG: MFS transporter [Deltaproteobacteria bacterium]|nr:MFS transporter [Deltaproteobacteria bacterium]
MLSSLPPWLQELLPIVTLLVVVSLVVSRLPRVDVGHSPRFLRRRVLNWLPVGLTYAFLYMGRYNLNACIGTLYDKAQFSDIYAVGTLTYGVSFLVNGPLTDRLGGKKTIVIAALGALTANVLLGLLATHALSAGFIPPDSRTHLPVVPVADRAQWVPYFSALYAMNMYFQSFGAVSIVKVNAQWFHLRERGTFGGIFGILISLGLYFAFDWCKFLVEHYPAGWTFWVPAGLLGLWALADLAVVRDSPSGAGLEDFDPGDASSTEDASRKATVLEVATRMLKNPAIVTIAMIEFCSGYLRNAILQYYKPYVKDLQLRGDYVMEHWGMLNCIAGILGGVLAGVISDRIFGSRRGPVSAVLYGVMIAGCGVMFFALGTGALGWVLMLMSLAIIGVHGMLSGTASMDFGGKRNAGVAVGIIDGFVYLGVAAEAVVLGRVLPKGAAAHDPANWWTWPAAILPAAVVGFLLALRVWNARAQPKGAH